MYAGLGDGGDGDDGGMVYVQKFEVSSSIFKLVLGIEHKSLGLWGKYLYFLSHLLSPLFFFNLIVLFYFFF